MRKLEFPVHIRIRGSVKNISIWEARMPTTLGRMPTTLDPYAGLSPEAYEAARKCAWEIQNKMLGGQGGSKAPAGPQVKTSQRNQFNGLPPSPSKRQPAPPPPRLQPGNSTGQGGYPKAANNGGRAFPNGGHNPPVYGNAVPMYGNVPPMYEAGRPQRDETLVRNAFTPTASQYSPGSRPAPKVPSDQRKWQGAGGRTGGDEPVPVTAVRVAPAHQVAKNETVRSAKGSKGNAVTRWWAKQAEEVRQFMTDPLEYKHDPSLSPEENRINAQKLADQLYFQHY
jgi:hypothetical protein